MQTRERIRAQQEHSHDEALDAFIAEKLEIDAIMRRLRTLSHVGMLGHSAQLLRQVDDRAFQKGERAS